MTEQEFRKMMRAYNAMQIAITLCARQGLKPTLWSRIRMELMAIRINRTAARNGYRMVWTHWYYFGKDGAPRKAYRVEEY